MQIISQINDERIDKYLAQNTDFSRSTIDKMLKSAAILVNNKAIKASYKVRMLDVISLDDNFKEIPEIIPTKMPLEIIYEDAYLMILNKPSGLVVHPGCGNYNNTLVNGLMAYTSDLSTGSSAFRPGIVHRIDKDTSGLIMIAKDNVTHEKLALMFKKHVIKRQYIALICGVLEHDKMTIDAPIGRDKNDRKKMCVTASNSKKAITHVEIMKKYEKYTLVKCQLETGRTHQIRVHMKYINHPIFNDPVYRSEEHTSELQS